MSFCLRCQGDYLNKKLSYCWDSARYDKITDNGRSANPNRNHNRT